MWAKRVAGAVVIMLGALAQLPAHAADHLVIDQAGDANGLGIVTPAGSDASLDILAGDISVVDGNLVFTITLAATPFDGSPITDPAFNFSINTARGAVDFFGGIHDSHVLGGVAYFGASGATPIDAPATVDDVAHTFTVSAPLSAVNALITTGSASTDEPLQSGSHLFNPTISSQSALSVQVGPVFAGGFTTRGADTATATVTYTMP